MNLAFNINIRGSATMGSIMPMFAFTLKQVDLCSMLQYLLMREIIKIKDVFVCSLFFFILVFEQRCFIVMIMQSIKIIKLGIAIRIVTHKGELNCTLYKK